MINIRGPREIERIRASGRLVAEALELVGGLIVPGVTTGELDRAVEEFVRSRGAAPEFKGFRGYPAAICASVNEEVVHGIPGDRRLEEGDIVGVDVGIRKDGYVADAARTFAVGEIDEEARRLLAATERALVAGVAAVVRGAFLSDVSHAIQKAAEAAGFSVVRELAGHGVGTELHEPPEIPNFGEPGHGPVLKPGMVFALEPMVNVGAPGVETLADGWTVVTADRGRSAHFEHTIAVTVNGADVMTQSG